MAINFTPDDVASGFNLSKLNSNFDKTQTALQDALSRSGNGPNQMNADIDLNSNDLLNVKQIDADVLTLNGDVVQKVDLATALKSSNALSEFVALGNQATARTNLGLDSAATQPISAFATAEQGRLGEQPFVYNKEIILQGIAGIDITGVTSSSTALNALVAANPHANFIIPREGKILLDQNLVLNYGQKLSGEFNPNDATGLSFQYQNAGYSVRLSGGAHIRLDNGGELQGLLIYRQGLVFNVDQGDFSTWTGDGVQLAFGNDQRIRDCMILGFRTCINSLNARGLNGSGRVVIDRVYVDGYNGIKLVGSYDTAYINRVRAFCFVTQAFAGTPAGGETYDPRKDRRPGIGFELVDRSDGTKLEDIEIFGYFTGFKANTASWEAGKLTVDYPTTPTYNTGGSGTIGVLLTKDVDPTGPRNVDYDPCQIGVMQIWSPETGLKIVGDAGRVAQIGTGAILNTYGDAIQIDGGGLIAPNMRTALTSGAPVRFVSAPNTKTIIKGRANNFGAARNSNNVPVVKIPASSNVNLVEVWMDNDQTVGAAYYDNHPTLPSVASVDPLNLPSYHGGGVESFLVTGTNNFAGMYGLRPGIVRLYFQSGLTLFAGAFSGGLRLPGGAANLAVAAGACVTFEYNATADRWYVVSVAA